MGADGGSIPSRSEVVKERRKDGDVKIDKWAVCNLSKKRLEEPIVVDKYGNLFNKTAVIEHLLDKTGPLKSLKEVTTLRIKRQWICPVTGHDAHSHRFVCVKPCGHAMAMSAAAKMTQCPVCEMDLKGLVELNPLPR